MTPEIMIMAGMLAAMFKDAEIASDKLNASDREGILHEAAVILAVSDFPVPIPDVKKDKAHWDELKSLMRDSIDVSIAIILVNGTPSVLLTKAKLPFDFHPGTNHEWIEAMKDHADDSHEAAMATFTGLMNRITQ